MSSKPKKKKLPRSPNDAEVAASAIAAVQTLAERVGALQRVQVDLVGVLALAAHAERVACVAACSEIHAALVAHDTPPSRIGASDVAKCIAAIRARGVVDE